MTTTHGIDFRHGLVDISMSILGCECGESFSTVSSDLIAADARNAAEHAVHADFMAEMDANWTITEAAHPDCTDCAELKKPAVTHARAMGSIGCTYTDRGHSCTANRADH